MTTDERIWRIYLQVLALQLRQSESPNEDKEKWKQIIWKNLLTINMRAQAFNPQSLPLDLPCHVPSADGRWCADMTASLWRLFCGVDIASTTKID